MIITDKAQIKVASFKESDKLHLTTSDELECYELIESDLKLPVDATFTRSSVAYLSDGTQVDANQPRFEQGRFGKAILIEEGTENIISSIELEKNGQVILGEDSIGTYFIKDADAIWYAGICLPRVPVLSGQYYTFSLEIMSDVEFNIRWDGNITADNDGGSNDISRERFIFYPNRYDSPGEWKKLIVTVKVKEDAQNPKAWDAFCPTDPSVLGHKIYYRNWQLEQKPYATSFIDGTRSPETLTIPTAGVLNPQEGTVECWVYFDANSLASNKETFWIIGTAKTKYADRIILQRLGSNLRFQVSNGTTTTTISFPLSNINIGWHYLAARWSTSEVSLFLDGTKIATASNPNLPQSLAANCGIGYNIVSGAEQCNTLIDDLRISSIARSDEEILAAYQSGQPLPADEWTTYKLDFDDKVRITTQGQIICNELIEI